MSQKLSVPCGTRLRCTKITASPTSGVTSCRRVVSRSVLSSRNFPGVNCSACVGNPALKGQERKQTMRAPLKLTKPLMLVSDLDGTMIWEPRWDAATLQFRQLWDANRHGPVPCKLVYNTGRTKPLYDEIFTLKGHVMAQPDVLIGGVGTRIYYRSDNGDWEEDREWADTVMNIGWEPAAALAAVDAAIARIGPSNMMLHEPREVHEHKLTAKVRSELAEQALESLRAELRARTVEATFVHGRMMGGKWFFVDVLPQRAGKGGAMEYVRQRLGFEEDAVVACGDAENDMLMLQQARRGVIVSNCVPELRQWAVAKQKGTAGDADSDSRLVEGHALNGYGTGPRSMLTADASGQIVYLAKSSVALGILEGLNAHGFLE